MKSDGLKPLPVFRQPHIQVGILYLIGLLIFVLFADRSSLFFTTLNTIMFLLSWLVVCVNVYYLFKQGLRLYHVFLIPFFTSLAWNTFYLSRLQSPKEAADLYYFFLGPLVFGIFLFFAEHIKCPKRRPVPPIRIPAMWAVWTLMAVFLAARIWIFKQTGVKLFDYLGGEVGLGRNQWISMVSGIATIAQWTLLILLPNVSMRMKVVAVSTVILFSGVLAMKRGEIVRIVVFLFLLYLVQRKRRFHKKAVTYMVIFFIVAILLFPLFGQIRQSYSAKFNISKLLKSEGNNALLGWIYAYSALNFDVLRLYVKQKPHQYPHTILMPLARLWGNKEAINKHLETARALKLGPFNAATFLGPFVRDFGPFYIFELAAFGLILMFVVMGIRIFDLQGVYTYMMLLVFLMFFGNYFMLPGLFYTIFLGSILTFFTTSSLESAYQKEQ